VAVAAGVLVLGEPLTPSILGAFALIMGGSLLATGVRPPGRGQRGRPVRVTGSAAPAPG